MISIAEPRIEERERAAVDSVLIDGQLADGPEVRAFEREFATYCGTESAVATSNGTTALHTALVALGVGPGDTVLTTPFSFIATANAARLVGSDVGFVDIDPQTYCIDPDRLESRLRQGDDVDAVIAVHLFGLPAAMHRLVELSEEYGFDLIEDAAQAHGAKVDGERVGSLGDVGCFSFYPTKNMTTGEGGMLTTNRADVAERAARFIDHGRSDGYRHSMVGHNFRMTSIAAAMGRVQLERLPAFIEARRSNAERLTSHLNRMGFDGPIEPPGRTHVYNQYTITHTERDRLKHHLADQGIGSAVYYPEPITSQAPYAAVDDAVPVAERCSQEVLSLPVHPGISESDIDQIAAAIAAGIEVTP